MIEMPAENMTLTINYRSESIEMPVNIDYLKHVSDPVANLIRRMCNKIDCKHDGHMEPNKLPWNDCPKCYQPTGEKASWSLEKPTVTK